MHTFEAVVNRSSNGGTTLDAAKLQIGVKQYSMHATGHGEQRQVYYDVNLWSFASGSAATRTPLGTPSSRRVMIPPLRFCGHFCCCADRSTDAPHRMVAISW